MPRVDPPYPSISFVLSSPEPRIARSSRLPAYRSSHMGRFHPYPRSQPKCREDPLMMTMDRRYEDEPLWEGEDAVDDPRVSSDETVLEGNDTADEADAVGAANAEPKQGGGGDAQTFRGRVKPVKVVLKVLAEVRHKYSFLGAVKRVLQA